MSQILILLDVVCVGVEVLTAMCILTFPVISLVGKYYLLFGAVTDPQHIVDLGTP
jgi:hypothetical protein